MPEVFCACKSHCTTYNHETRTYDGGQFINRTTTFRHRLDDNRSTTLDSFTHQVASSILNESPGLGLPRTSNEAISLSPLQTAALPGEVITIEGEIRDRISWTATDKPLAFTTNPIPDLEFENPLASPHYIPNSGRHVLHPSDPKNIAFIENESRLYEIHGHLRTDMLVVDQEVLDDLVDKVITGLHRMMEHKRYEWERQCSKTRAIVKGYAVVNTEEYMADDLPKEPTVLTALLTVLLMNLGVHRDSDKLPDDPRTVVNRFDLDPHCSSFLQCPACYALYPYTGTIMSTPPEIKRCIHKQTPTSAPCDVPLWDERQLGGRTTRTPRWKYVHQSLKEWVGRLLTCPGVKELLREPCDKPKTLIMEDIWDAPVLRNFRDVDGEPFFRGRCSELRLAFSLNADRFHPLHMLEAKQTLSCTTIYMVLLNFPPRLRYLFRNMYLAGVIPGPGKPSLDQINHVLSLLVLELLDFWRGVFYTITFASASGLLTKGALIPLVWWINASIEGGDGTVIKPNKSISRPNNQVFSKWLAVIRDTDPNLLHDELSRDCSKETLWHICVDNNIRSAGTRKQLIKHIVKWQSRVNPNSIRLPIVSEPDEGDNESTEFDSKEEGERRFQREVEKVGKTFEEHKTSERGLGHIRKPILWAMCQSRRIEVEEKDKVDLLVERLIAWRDSNIPVPPEPVSESREVLGRNILEAAWDDMTRTEIPLWMSAAPRNWGTATRGKLTTDQWKVIATVHLPITLMRLWGALQEGRYFLMLCNFMDLSAAVQLANQQVITEKHIEDYERLILRYLSGMMIMFKDTPLQPIHHVSVHAGEFLCLFGPTHSVRTPGFERFNEKLGLQNTNRKSGELEATFTTTACRMANLEWMMQGQGLQDSVRPLVEAFSKVYNEDHRGTRLADEAHFPPNKPPKVVTLNHHVRQLLLQIMNSPSTMGSHSFHTPDAIELKKVSIYSIIYANEKSLPRDSNIIFQWPGGSSHRVGRIKLIFQVRYQPGATFLTVSQHHLIMNSDVRNVYRRFGFAGGFLCNAEEDNRLLVIRSKDVVCHFAKTALEPKEEKLMHALPLNTKMLEYLIPEDYPRPEH
ncbi:hypothetical protein BDM02DRAFT_3191016 [Thelephora ganbajun]|uniref:Uncharacterized protein n=1 Tax=Thelephora ganbajun TaxID=370292 RepID=A0ACB6Z2L3_THEGA|nr:hypothetical protein BDM02DRAFT_3191016 [Thelephora ganbajun]